MATRKKKKKKKKKKRKKNKRCQHCIQLQQVLAITIGSKQIGRTYAGLSNIIQYEILYACMLVWACACMCGVCSVCISVCMIRLYFKKSHFCPFFGPFWTILGLKMKNLIFFYKICIHLFISFPTIYDMTIFQENQFLTNFGPFLGHFGPKNEKFQKKL